MPSGSEFPRQAIWPAGAAVEVEIEARANSRAICSGCGDKRPAYDRLPPRRFQFLPLWSIAVFFVYAMRRVDCPACGVTVERVPWGEGKEHFTTSELFHVLGRVPEPAFTRRFC